MHLQQKINKSNKLQYPFTLGIASGDPLPDGVVLWTRLAPDPLNGGGMDNHPFPVQWEVSLDANFKNVVKRGNELSKPSSVTLSMLKWRA